MSPVKHGIMPVTPQLHASVVCVTWGRRQEAFLHVRGDGKVLRAEIISRGDLGSVQNCSSHLYTIECLAAGRKADL